MNRILGLLRRGLAFAFLFAVLLLGTVALLLNTTVGSRLVIDIGAGFVPGSLYVDGVEGTLWRTLGIRVLRYRNESVEIDGDDVELVISWPNLVAGSFVLNSLTVGTMDTRSLAPSSDEPEPLSVSMPPLPFSLSIGAGGVDSFILQRDAGDFLVTDIDWAEIGLDGQRIAIRDASLDFPQLGIDNASIDATLAGDVPLTGSFAWATTDDSAAGSATLGGTLTELSVSHSLISPLEIATAGRVYLQGRTEPGFDLLSDIRSYQAGTVLIENATIRLAGTLDDYAANIAAQVSEPRLPGSSVSAVASGNLSGLEDGVFTLTSEYWSAIATGAVAWRPAIDIALDVDAERLEPSFLDERLAGELEVALQFAFAADGEWRADKLRVAGSLMDFDVSASGDIASADQRILCAACVATVRRQTGPAVDVTAWIEGTDQAIDVVVEGEVGALQDLAAAGSIQRGPGGLSGTLNRVSVNESWTGRWVLGTPLDFRVGDAGLEVDAHRWVLPEGQIDVSRIAFSPQQVSIVGAASALPLAAANAFLPDGLRLEGTATAQVDVTREASDWSGDVHWQQAGTKLHVDRPGDEPFMLNIPEAVADADFEGGGASVASTVRIDPGIRVLTTATIDSLEQDPQIDARAVIEGDQWQWLTALLPELENLGGDISAELVANGALIAPRFGGTVRWRDGTANVPGLNVPLRDIDISLVVDDGATVDGTAIAGEGPLTINGRADKIFSADRQVELSLHGEAAEIVNWPEYHVWASPDLTVSGSAGGWDARGTVDIPRAEIDVRELPEDAVAISEDVRVASIDYSTSMEGGRYSGEADIVLGDAVRVSAFGLDTRLEGALTVRKNPDRDLTLEGTVTLVDGVFEAYGQRLTIEEGTLTFTGPADNPIVDVRATRTIEDFDNSIVAGIHLTGRAQQINSSVYAEPAMSEADALSYLVIGRPLSEATAGEGGELSDAAVRLGLRQAARITQQIGQSLGLDELTIIGDGGDATALVAGKQFNDRLYARYAYGVFSRLGMIMIRYRLTKRLSLEAGAGETQSIDVLYSIEKE